MIDISERKRSEEACRVQEQFLRATIDGLGAHVCVINTQGKIVITNRAWNTFAAENNAVKGTCGEGASYLDACRAPSKDEKTISRSSPRQSKESSTVV